MSVLSIVRKGIDETIRKEREVLKITYVDNSHEIVPCDEFGKSEISPGFIELWTVNPDKLMCIVNTLSIKKIELIVEEVE